MEWYYAENNERRGPVGDAEFNELVRTGRIVPTTQVWREGWPNWAPYSEAGAQTTPDGAPGARCVECGGTFAASEMIQYEGSSVCANCKPIFFQKVKEGITPTGQFVFAGFWIRFVAKFIDGILQQVVVFVANLVLGAVISAAEAPTAFFVVSLTLSMLLSGAYSIFFTGKYGATLGKMALGLKVVRAGGGAVGYGLAAGRFFAELLSSFTLLIGYIIAAFDDEKRTLHDRICNTRVIRTRA